MLRLKRAYEAPVKEDGVRVLVERLWPRGLTKQQAKVDVWLKELAPSAALRTWFGHDPVKWAVFRKRYAAELKNHADLLNRLRAKAQRGTVTLVFATRDVQHSSAAALKQLLECRRSVHEDDLSR